MAQQIPFGRLAAIWLLSAATLLAASAKRKVIIDQDAFGPGGPDLQPILMALQSPDVEVLGITVESGDGWQKENVAHTLRMLEIVGRPEVPVVPGATFPLVNSAAAVKKWEARYGKMVYKGAWTEEWPAGMNVHRPPMHPAEVVPPLAEGEPTLKPAMERAADFMIRKVHEFPGQVSILALGPMTNIALAVRLDDTFAGEVRQLVFMGGSFNPQPSAGGFGAEYAHSPRREFNFWWDPEAARIMLHAPWHEMVQVPVDATAKTFFTPELIARVRQSTSVVARYVGQYAESFPMWDELGVAVWLEPAIAKKPETMAVDVDTDQGAGYGSTLSWPAGQGPGLGERNVSVVLDVDVARLNALVVERLTR